MKEKVEMSANTTGNVILAAILATLVFLCVDQRLSIKNSRESQDKLYALTKSFAGHVWTEDLKNEGRRLAFAEHFAEQTLKGDDRYNYKKLLEHGSEGIESYLSLEGGREVAQSTKNYVSTNSAYAWQLLMATYFPATTSITTHDKATDEHKNYSTRNHPQLEKGAKSDE
jgi:hypothetical protein